MGRTEAAWRREHAAAYAALPAEWVWTDPADEWQGIDPEHAGHAGHPLVRHYSRLAQVGYARGWM